jgi:hypothetical protein
MPGPKLNLARTVVWWKVSPFPETLSIPTPALGTANVTVVLLGAIERMFLRRATFVPLTANVTGTTTTVQIQNFTKTLNLTNTLDLTGDVAKVALPMVLTADGNLLVLPKDVLVLQYNFGSATVGPGVAVVTLEFALSGKYA